jgi:hypothetical protein
MPNNISNWKVFEGDEQIINFLTNQDNFKDLAIDDEAFQEQSMENQPSYRSTNGQIKVSHNPKGDS